MQRITLHDLSKAIVFSDLHLNILRGRFEEVQRQRIEDILDRENPKTVILNGDTVDLFFGIRGGRRGTAIESILATNEHLVRVLQGVPNLYFLAGAHDQAVRWDKRLCDTDGLVDPDAEIVIMPGVQWYYDNAVHAGTQWLSLTKELTSAFEDFILSGTLDASALESAYMQGRLGFWYRTGSHYEFLQGMGKAFRCRVADYFENLAFICRSSDFRAWVEQQFYDEYRVVGHLAGIYAEDGGPAIEALAAPYWRMLGRVVKQKIGYYLDAGRLDYPPHADVPFEIAVVGHTHLAHTYSSTSGRRMLFTGTTKPQTRISGASGIAQNEFGGGYVVIEREGARLEKCEPAKWTTDLQTLSAESQVSPEVQGLPNQPT
jgi:hypothetical protein